MHMCIQYTHVCIGQSVAKSIIKQKSVAIIKQKIEEEAVLLLKVSVDLSDNKSDPVNELQELITMGISNTKIIVHVYYN